jgi:inner membrane protein
MSMDDEPSAPAAPGNFRNISGNHHLPAATFQRSPAAKFLFAGLLSLALMIPLWMVLALTSDRAERRDEVMRSVGHEWGMPQSVVGPVLVIPFLTAGSVRNDGRQTSPVLHHLAILPETFTANVNANAEERAISIYSVPVYSSAIAATGRFAPVTAAGFGGNADVIQWDKAYISVGISDLSGIEDAALTIGGAKLTFDPGLSDNGSFVKLDGEVVSALSGVHAALAASGPIAGFDYALDLRLRGTASLRVAPIGRQSAIAMASNWAHPNFSIGMLPSERTVAADGFKASWRVPYLARTTPQAWVVEREGHFYVGDNTLGVGFVVPVDVYTLVARALKYGVMFIGATFLTVFMLEVLSPRRIHIVQYSLVGLVLVMFFILLLALAEQIGFGVAYLVASAATGAVVSGFVGTVLQSVAKAMVAAASFAVTFGLLYAILRLEDLALLSGAVAGFALVTIVLFATRKVDWSGLAGRAAVPQTQAG